MSPHSTGCLPVIVVSDTSPISALLTVGHARLLVELFGDVLIPPAVADELAATHAAVPDFLHIREPRDVAAVEALCVGIDRGEAQTIVVAREQHADLLLMDERAGRRVERQQGLAFTGVLGVLIRAKKQGLIGRVGPVIERLVSDAGLYVSAEVVADALRLADEG